MIYLASPYTHEDPEVRQKRFDEVCWYAAYLMRLGEVVYSPIAHGHAIAVLTGNELPTDWEFWKKHCISMLKKADELYVCQMDGWFTSRGVLAEIAYAQTVTGMPIRYIDWSGVKC